MRALVVTAMIGDANVFIPVADRLKGGVDFFVVAEGLSPARWTQAGYSIIGGEPKEGRFDPNTKIRFDIDPEQVLREVRPDVVMTGLAEPNHLTKLFALEANKQDIALIFVEDIWGVHKRSEARPAAICTLDGFGEHMALKHYDPDHDRLVGERDPVSGYFNDLPASKAPPIYITGSPAMDSLQSVQPHPQVEKLIRGRGMSVLFLGQDESTTPALEGLVEALRGVDDSVLIPRFHPKWMADPSKAEHRARWENALLGIKDQSRVLWSMPPEAKAEQVIRSVDVVVSIYSTGLLQAAMMGKCAVSWNSLVGRKKMLEGIGLEHFPLTQSGAAIEVWSPGDFASKVPLPGSPEHSKFVTAAQQKVGGDCKSTDRVAKVVLDIIKACRRVRGQAERV